MTALYKNKFISHKLQLLWAEIHPYLFRVLFIATFRGQWNTGRFIMISVITNIYNKKTKRPTLMELVTATVKLKFFLATRDVWCVHHGWHGTHRYAIHGTDHRSSGEYRYTHVDACVARTWMSYRCVPCHPWFTYRTRLVVKKNFFSFTAAVNSSIKVGPLVFLL
jgi:hypothetical protein